ncbi:MAG: hypothetical protein ACE37N_03470 [Pseudohongiellaceae bacterium]|jgi:hypothetical protein
MAKQNRETLKRFFSAGKLPSEEHFADLVDSSMNIIDEGFAKTEQFGFEITPQKGTDDTENLISFFRKLTDKLPSWSISYYAKDEALQFVHTEAGSNERKTVLSLDKDGKLSICSSEFNEQTLLADNANGEPLRLDVGGAIRAPARLGVGLAGQTTVPANGLFQPITEKLHGFQALEVVATVELKEQKRFAIMHAIAINAHSPPWRILNFWNRGRRIRVHQSYHSGPKDRLKLKWVTVEDDDNPGVSQYRLCIKSAFRYPGDVQIKYHVTKLWGQDWIADTEASLAGEVDSNV